MTGGMWVAGTHTEFQAMVEAHGLRGALTGLGLGEADLHEASWARSERLFWTVAAPHGYPGPDTHDAIAGAWFHGAALAAVVRRRDHELPTRAVTLQDLQHAVHTFETEATATGDSAVTLARFAMVRAELTPQFVAHVPDAAWAAVVTEAGMTPAVARECLALFAIDGAVVARIALDHAATDHPARPRRDPGRPDDAAREPTGPPIEMLGVVGSLIDGQLAEHREQYRLLVEAAVRGPYVLDDATITRVQAVYREAAQLLDLYDEQLGRWAAGPLTDDQATEVTRLHAALPPLREAVTAVLALAGDLTDQTIETLLAKPDLEVGLEWLLRHPDR